LAIPTLVDDALPGAVLIFLPALIVLYIVNAITKRFSKTHSLKIAAIVLGLIFAMVITWISLADYLLALAIIGCSVVVFLLYRQKTLEWSLIFLSWCFLCFSPYVIPRKVHTPRVLVLGLDAMTPNIVDSLVNIGELHNIRNLMNNGASGVLLTEEPLISPVIWTTIATGRNRYIHGVGDFYCGNAEVKVPRLWHMFEDNGWKVGVFRWLATWPPEAVNGFQVPSALARDQSSHPEGYGDINAFNDLFRAPTDYSVRQIARIGWNVTKAGAKGSTILGLLKEASRSNLTLRDGNYLFRWGRLVDLELSTDIFLNMTQKYQPDFVLFYTNIIDMMSHRYWKYLYYREFKIQLAEAEDYCDFVCDAYRYCDAVTGRILEDWDENIKIAVLSDHGIRSIGAGGESLFWANTETLFKDLNLEGRLYSQLVGSWQFVYPVKSENQDSLMADIQKRLDRIVYSDGRKMFIIALHETGELVLMTDYIETDTTKLYIEGKTIPATRYIQRLDISGAHSLQGQIIFSGENINKLKVIQGATIYDFAPTLLHWSDLPVDSTMEGRVLKEIFENPGTITCIPEYQFPRSQEFDSSKSKEIDDKTKERLKAMGYVK
jgi:predicted AlkP superfamily phosphohydrolase/phosphomutase